jgi:hypothetical protein
VHERRRLQRVVLPLAAQVDGGEPVQLVVDERQQGIPGTGIALVPGQQQRRRSRSGVGNAVILSGLHLFAGSSRCFRQEGTYAQ